MKEIKLTRGKVALVDDEDFEFLNQFKWFAKKSYNSVDTYYAYRNEPGSGKERRKLIMHRVIMNASSTVFIDHINHNGLDNRKRNLRECNYSQNAANQRLRKTKINQFKGVCKKGNVWVSRVGFNGKQIYLGTYKNLFAAASAYNEKAKELFGEFANLNQLDSL